MQHTLQPSVDNTEHMTVIAMVDLVADASSNLFELYVSTARDLAALGPPVASALVPTALPASSSSAAPMSDSDSNMLSACSVSSTATPVVRQPHLQPSSRSSRRSLASAPPLLPPRPILLSVPRPLLALATRRRNGRPRRPEMAEIRTKNRNEPLPLLRSRWSKDHSSPRR